MNGMLYVYMSGATYEERNACALEHTKYFLPWLQHEGEIGSSNGFVHTNEYKIMQENISDVTFSVVDINVKLLYDFETKTLSTPERFPT